MSDRNYISEQVGKKRSVSKACSSVKILICKIKIHLIYIMRCDMLTIVRII